MKKEYSAGVVVFYNGKDVPEFLLLHYEAGHWDFPKGHIELNETKEQAALRELKEETGISSVELLPGFEESFSYFFHYPHNPELIKKDVHFFLGKAFEKIVTLSHEHNGYEWLPYEQAVKKLTYKNAQELLQKADAFIRKNMMH